MTEANTNQLTELNRTIRDQRKTIGGLNKKITTLEKSNRGLQNIADTNQARVEKLTEERDREGNYKRSARDRAEQIERELISAQKEIERLKSTRQTVAEDHADIVSERDELLGRERILIAALQHYAGKPCIQKDDIGRDIGYIARKYLREIGGDSEMSDHPSEMVAYYERERQEKLTSSLPDPRPEVQWFAKRMELKLQANDHKQHWSKCHPDYLIDRLFQETDELWRAIENGEPGENVIDEAADVANFAMMIADRIGQMRKEADGA